MLDAFRFLRDVAEPDGGLQRAVSRRGGISRLRSLYARREPDIGLEVDLDIEGRAWGYRLRFGQDNARRLIVKEERVCRPDKCFLERPDAEDAADPGRLAQTHLEQVNTNKEFREVARALASVRYLHIVPQLVREPGRYAPPGGDSDPYGGDFLERLARTQKEQTRTFRSRLRRINDALKVAVPQFRDLKLERDETGRPHLFARHEHWRPRAGWQSEDQFSDGTLRLLGLLWAVVEGTGPLLLEDPELSLHEALIRLLPSIMWHATRKSRRQIVISTHSAALLSDGGIAAEEVLVLRPTRNGTTVELASASKEVRVLLEKGLAAGEVVLPRVAPENPEQLLLKFVG
ncbi:MAG: ATP-binding protein [Myxococcales bacterium]|nr:ATP-binding protein [Myxococcales bacterium]